MEFKEAVKIAKNIYTNKITNKNQFEILWDEICFNLLNDLPYKPITYTFKNDQIIQFNVSNIKPLTYDDIKDFI